MLEKNVLAIFLKDPISKNSIFYSKIFQEKVMVINFCFIVIYQLNIDMRSTRDENTDFSSLCKKMKNPFFQIFRILVEDKNRKRFYSTFQIWGSQKIILKCFISVNENLNHKGLNTRVFDSLFQLYEYKNIFLYAHSVLDIWYELQIYFRSLKLGTGQLKKTIYWYLK